MDVDGAHLGHQETSPELRRDGLTGAEAARRLAADGPNALPDHARLAQRQVEQRESIFLLLMVVLMLGMT
ncbi:cation-transporting P-type ATPase, partial [Telluria sp. Tellsp99]